MTVLYVISALLLFGILITAHEAGHFFAARMGGIPVREFAIGFGPALATWKSRKHDTVFFVRAIPIGGYCAFYDEDNPDAGQSDDPRSFPKHPVLKRLLTVVAGPVMNLVLAFVAAFALSVLIGVPVKTGDAYSVVQTVNVGSPAEAAGIKPGDRFVTLDGQHVTGNLSELINQGMKSGKASLHATVTREGAAEAVELEIKPLYSDKDKRYLVGVTSYVLQPQEYRPGNVAQMAKAAWDRCVYVTTQTLQFIGNLFSRGEGAGEVMGFVGITNTIVEQTREGKLPAYVNLMCLISINLALMNLLPIPGLDGSRILFLVVEGVRGKPMRKEAYVHMAGLILLLALTAFITLRDIMRLF